jgi:hypothetical protein
MDLTHEDIISLSDVLEMITQQNSWNSSEINIYSLSHIKYGSVGCEISTKTVSGL